MKTKLYSNNLILFFSFLMLMSTSCVSNQDDNEGPSSDNPDGFFHKKTESKIKPHEFSASLLLECEGLKKRTLEVTDFIKYYNKERSENLYISQLKGIMNWYTKDFTTKEKESVVYQGLNSVHKFNYIGDYFELLNLSDRFHDMCEVQILSKDIVRNYIISILYYYKMSEANPEFKHKQLVSELEKFVSFLKETSNLTEYLGSGNNGVEGMETAVKLIKTSKDDLKKYSMMDFIGLVSKNDLFTAF